MASVTPSQFAGHQAGQAVDKVVFEKTATALKQNYLILRAVPELSNDLIPPQDNEAFNAYIEGLAGEVLEGKTDRAKKIRKFMADKDPEKYAQLEQASAVRDAAAKAVSDNTGDYPILGGSTIANAFAGLIQWIFSGFEGGFEGLKNIIAKGAVVNVISDFNKNLQGQGIDTTQGFGKDAVDQFAQQALVKGGFAQPPAKEAPFNLAAVPIQGFDPNAAPSKPVEINKPEDVAPALTDHFKKIGESVRNVVISSPIGKKYEALLTDAENTLAQKGQELAQKIIAEKKPLPADFYFNVTKETFKEMQSKLTKPEDQAMVKKVLAEFDKPGATMDSVIANLQKSSDTQPAAMMLTLLNGQMISQDEKLKEIVRQALPDNAEAAKQAGESKELAQQSMIKNRKNIIDGIKGMVAGELNKAVNPVQVQQQIDKAISDYIVENYPTDPGKFKGNWFSRHWQAGVNKLTPNSALEAYGAPNAADRKEMAVFVSDQTKSIVADEINKAIDANGGKGINADEIAKKSMARFNSAFDKALAEGKIPASWADHKETVMASVEKQLREKLREQAPGINDALKPVAAIDGKLLSSLMSNKPTKDVPELAEAGHLNRPVTPSQGRSATAAVSA